MSAALVGLLLDGVAAVVLWLVVFVAAVFGELFGLSFADTWLLGVLAALTPCVILWRALQRLWSGRQGEPRRGALRFSSISLLKQIMPSATPGLRRLVMGLRVLVLALLALAMARPQTGHKRTQVSAKGIDIILAIDTSGSMRALDLDAGRPRIADRRNRLEVVKAVVDEFVQKRESDQIGMVVFGTEAYTQCPRTLDHGIVATFLERVEIGMAGDLTALGDGLGIAVKRLQKSQADSKVIILLTDGRQTAGQLSPVKAAEVAQSLGIKVYTIGAGTRGKAPFIESHPIFGDRIVMHEEPIDEETLTKIATTTGGEYFRAEDKKALEAIYAQIDEMETTEITTQTHMDYDERFGLFVIPALILLALEVLLLGTRLRKIP